MANEILEMALQYADIGIPVMPLHGINEDGSCTCKQGNKCSSTGKHPIFSGWQVKATTDKTIIMNWWNQYPNAYIGIPTGERSGWLVLDIDTKYDGNQTLKSLEKIHGQLPDTVTAITGSGGEHRIFKYPKGLKIPNKVSFDQGLDVRSNGGLIVAAPSLHASGNRYRWLDGHSPFDIEPVNAPKWLLDMMINKKPKLFWVIYTLLFLTEIPLTILYLVFDRKYPYLGIIFMVLLFIFTIIINPFILTKLGDNLEIKNKELIASLPTLIILFIAYIIPNLLDFLNKH